MKSRRIFESSSYRSGLVIVLPPDVTSLFNPDVHRLVRSVEDRLEGVFVTYALSSGAAPDVGAALKAVRFAGCTSAVVIHAEDWLGDAVGLDSSTDTLWDGSHLAAGLRDSAERVVAAYNRTLPPPGMAGWESRFVGRPIGGGRGEKRRRKRRGEF